MELKSIYDIPIKQAEQNIKLMIFMKCILSIYRVQIYLTRVYIRI